MKTNSKMVDLNLTISLRSLPREVNQGTEMRRSLSGHTEPGRGIQSREGGAGLQFSLWSLCLTRNMPLVLQTLDTSVLQTPSSCQIPQST